MTILTTSSAARANLTTLLNRVAREDEIVIIKRRKGGDVAMVSAGQLTGLLETVHLLRSQKNARRLLTALERVLSGFAKDRMPLHATSETLR